ncbi:MAG: succinate dehydrogenase/fumarate reductase iron-sulfur subunit [Epsilonproteobacteria bacterium]|nr:succinate dehydrogenase [Campylobacterota bacterium]NPA56176.1 succinate dehydrogenase/fumarate reductase iron-sulfur subunit [Campylobacterota bacterium]
MKVTLKVFRFNGERDYLPHYDTIEMEIDEKKDVVLDVLNRIKWEHDGSFTYRRSCRHGICGSCAIKVNGRSTLACKERMEDMVALFGTELVLEPVSKKRAIKDMVVDKSDFWERYERVKPWLEAEIDEHPTMENIIPPEEAEKLEESDYCIQCGCCYYACPVIEVNENYLGPAAFEKAFRFTADVRDHAKRERLEIVDRLGEGVWDCVKCFECAEACPKHIDPIGKITKLHNEIFKEGVARSNVATRHAVGFKHSIKKHGILDEGHLVAYSEGFGVLKHLPEAFEMWKKGKIVMPWEMPKSKKLDEIKKLVEIASTVRF